MALYERGGLLDTSAGHNLAIAVTETWKLEPGNFWINQTNFLNINHSFSGSPSPNLSKYWDVQLDCIVTYNELWRPAFLRSTTALLPAQLFSFPPLCLLKRLWAACLSCRSPIGNYMARQRSWNLSLDFICWTFWPGWPLYFLFVFVCIPLLSPPIRVSCSLSSRLAEPLGAVDSHLATGLDLWMSSPMWVLTWGTAWYCCLFVREWSSKGFLRVLCSSAASLACFVHKGCCFFEIILYKYWQGVSLGCCSRGGLTDGLPRCFR